MKTMKEVDYYKNAYKELQEICLQIYYARIAMNTEGVKNGLNKLDNYFKDKDNWN